MNNKDHQVGHCMYVKTIALYYQHLAFLNICANKCELKLEHHIFVKSESILEHRIFVKVNSESTLEDQRYKVS